MYYSLGEPLYKPVVVQVKQGLIYELTFYGLMFHTYVSFLAVMLLSLKLLSLQLTHGPLTDESQESRTESAHYC